jgi:hypothetical protein
MTGIHAFMTRQMKEDLRGCGFSEQQLAELTPQEGDEILAAAIAPDVDEVRAFITTIVRQARDATRYLSEADPPIDPGLLQMVLVHPSSDDPSGIYRYDLSDPDLIERMTRDAVSASAAGHNVYVEGRTVRRSVKGKERGKLTDTIAVFSLVIDNDSEKGKAWTATAPISLTVETSPGNSHNWLFWETALDYTTAQKFGERLRKATGADQDTGVITQPYRIAGTLNYPGKKKQERGRTRIESTRTLWAEDGDELPLWTPERFEKEFPATAPTDPGGGNGHDPDESRIPADTLREIQAQDAGKRGTRFWNVMIVLKSLGFTIDGIVRLFEKYPDGIAAKYRGRLRHQVETVWGKLTITDPKPTDTTVVVKSQADFLAGFVPPDYLVDGVLQRRFVYSLTAVTGHGKTAIALLLARACGSADPKARFGHAVEKGRVVYFVGENPDDVRCRVIGANSERSDNPDLDRIFYIEGVFDIAGLREKLVEAIDKLGGVDLVIVDTSAAYFLQDDENSNPQIGGHARMLRALTTLPGDPCVFVLCHPIKYVTEPSQLLPRGGGAFLAEMDGNLTAWLHDENLVTLHHNKIRGPGFEPITFRLEKITTEKLLDSKGRQMPTVHAVAISEQEEEEQEANAEREEDELLAALGSTKMRSIADLARACGWLLANGDPHKSKVDRVLARLKAAKPALIRQERNRRWRLTEEGRKAGGLDDDEAETTVEERSGAVGSKKAFHALQGMKQRPTVPCAFCGQMGDVYKFADGRLPKGQRHHADLHEGCAEAFFTGKPKPAAAEESVH